MQRRAIAQNKTKKRAESQTFGARFGGQVLQATAMLIISLQRSKDEA